GAFHEADEPVAALGPDGREPDAAVAHHDGGDAVPGGGAEERVPRDLPVVVGVDVDEAGGDDAAAGVDHVAALVIDVPDLGDAPPIDRHVARKGRRTGSVDDRRAADHQVVH